MMNADFRARVMLDTSSMAWQTLAVPSVQHQSLDQIDGAAASSTRMVKCAPGCVFSLTDIGYGEEMLVLDGVLADEHGEHGAGAYIRNPPGSQPALRTDQGCVLFVKSYFFDSADSAAVRIDTANARWLPGMVPGLSVLPLHQHQHEHAALVRWQPETYFQPHTHFGGEEILVLSGVFEDEFGRYPAGTWIRSPHMSRHQPFSRTGCTIYVKTGHLFVSDIAGH